MSSIAVLTGQRFICHTYAATKAGGNLQPIYRIVPNKKGVKSIDDNQRALAHTKSFIERTRQLRQESEEPVSPKITPDGGQP